MFTPRGCDTSNSCIRFMPDGSRVRFPTLQEYLKYTEYLNDLFGREAA